MLEVKRGQEAMFFPEELVDQILIRLPSKSLLRFKLVCKAWYNCISSQDFTFLHLNSYKPSEFYVADFVDGPWNILMSNYSVCRRGYAESTTSVNHRVPTNKITEGLLYDRFLSAQPCNGIFCIYGGSAGLFLWNPSIHDFKIIDMSNLSHPVLFSMGYVEFGFDPKTNDYKILHIFFDLGSNFQLHIYCLRANSWRKLDSSTFINPILLFHCPRLTIKSKIVWLTFDLELPSDSGQSQCQIYLFDLSTETFDMIPVSLEGLFDVRMNDIYGGKIRVFPFRESFALVISQAGVPSKAFEIWALNDCISSTCTHSRSWNKLCTIQFKHQLVHQPLGFWENSYFIFRDLINWNLVSYDLLNEEVVNQGAGGRYHAPYFPLLYRESLINVSNYH